MVCDLFQAPTERISGARIDELQTLPDLQKEGTAFLKPAPNVFLAGIEMQCDESDGRILLGDNTSGQAVMLRPIGSQRAGVRVSTGLPSTYMVTACWS